MKYPPSHLTPFPPTFPRETACKTIAAARNCARAPAIPLTTFRMNTCKSVSKQRTLSTFRMNTYAKPGGGGPQTRSARLKSAATLQRKQIPHTARKRPSGFPSRIGAGGMTGWVAVIVSGRGERRRILNSTSSRRWHRTWRGISRPRTRPVWGP